MSFAIIIIIIMLSADMKKNRNIFATLQHFGSFYSPINVLAAFSSKNWPNGVKKQVSKVEGFVTNGQNVNGSKWNGMALNFIIVFTYVIDSFLWMIYDLIDSLHIYNRIQYCLIIIAHFTMILIVFIPAFAAVNTCIDFIFAILLMFCARIRNIGLHKTKEEMQSNQF